MCLHCACHFNININIAFGIENKNIKQNENSKYFYRKNFKR